MFSLIRSPKWMQNLYSESTWDLPGEQPVLYLTFDDGPHPETTPLLLNILKKAEVRATFFCLGKQVGKYPELLDLIKQNGHSIGHHTYMHLNSWKCPVDIFLQDYHKGKELIGTRLFRPPYGSLKPAAYSYISKYDKVIFWSLNSKDYLPERPAGKILRPLMKHGRNGDIILMHEHPHMTKKFPQILPPFISHFQKQGFSFAGIEC